jgi:hypothetical protein
MNNEHIITGDFLGAGLPASMIISLIDHLDRRWGRED